MDRPQRRPSHAPARHRAAAGRTGAAVCAQPPALPRSAVGPVVGRPGGGAGQRQAAPARGRMDRGQLRRALGLRHGRRGRCAAGRHRAPGRAGLARRRRAAGRGVGPLGRAGGRARAGRHRLAVLHQWHHRPPQGRDAERAQPDDHGPGLSRRRRSGRAPGRHCLRRPHLARRGALLDPAPDGRRASRGAGLGRLRRRRAVRAGPRRRAAVAVCRAHHRRAPGRPRAAAGSVARRLRSRLQDHRLRRRTHVPGRHPARAAGDGPTLRANLRSGRNAHGGHRALARRPGRHEAPAPPAAPGQHRRGPDPGARARDRRGRARPAAGRDRPGATCRRARSARCWCAATA